MISILNILYYTYENSGVVHHLPIIKVKPCSNHLKVLEPFANIRLSLPLCLYAPSAGNCLYITTHFFLEIKNAVAV